MRAALVVLAAACGQHHDAAPAPSESPRSTPVIGDDVRIKVCKAEPCGGDRPSIDVYRDTAGTVKKLYRLYGSCFHSPGIYFDPDGTQTEIIPEKPIVPGSDEAKQIEAKHQAQVGGLTKGESISCRGVK